jgi:hypothetical protein
LGFKKNFSFGDAKVMKVFIFQTFFQNDKNPCNISQMGFLVTSCRFSVAGYQVPETQVSIGNKQNSENDGFRESENGESGNQELRRTANSEQRTVNSEPETDLLTK